MFSVHNRSYYNIAKNKVHFETSQSSHFNQSCEEANSIGLHVEDKDESEEQHDQNLNKKVFEEQQEKGDQKNRMTKNPKQKVFDHDEKLTKRTE